MTSQELIAMLKTERAFFDTLPDLQEALVYGSALMETELKDDIDLLLIPAGDLSEGEKVDLRQAVWEHFKDRLPVMFDVVTPTAERSKETLSAKGAATVVVYAK